MTVMHREGDSYIFLGNINLTFFLLFYVVFFLFKVGEKKKKVLLKQLYDSTIIWLDLNTKKKFTLIGS
jgi:hypothetical protein